MLARRALLAASALVFAVGCTGKTDFTITKTFTLDTTAGVLYSDSKDVDLAAEAGGAWKHRSKIKSLDLVGLDARLSERTDGGAATQGSGQIVLSRGGTDAVVGTWTNHAIPDGAHVPDSISVTLDPAAMSIVNEAIHSDGLFTVKFKATTDAHVAGTAIVDLHMKLTYKVP